MGQGLSGIFEAYGAGTAPSSPPNSSILVATQLYKYSSRHCVDLAQIGLAKWLS
jgi:hypothetical protein